MNKLYETVGIIVVGIATITFAAALSTVPIWLLWNWIMPAFGLPTITIWRAWGLLVLCGLLFKNATTKK